MKKLISLLAVVMIALMAIVPMASASAASSDGFTMYVSSSNGHGVRMRQAPSTDGKVMYNLGEGRPVTVTSTTVGNGFYAVEVQIRGKWYSGYIMSKFLSTTNPLNLKQTFKTISSFTIRTMTASKNGVVSMWDTTSKLNEHKIRDLSNSERLTVLAESRAWYKVMDTSGMIGYVAKAYVTKA